MAEAGLERGHRGPGTWEVPFQVTPTPTRYGNPLFCLLELVFRTRLMSKSKTASCLKGPRFRVEIFGGGVCRGLITGDQAWDSHPVMTWCCYLFKMLL